MDNQESIKYDQRALGAKGEVCAERTITVTQKEIEDEKKGIINIKLTAKKPVPRAWFPGKLSNVKILCLSCGDGQQAPVLSAAGASVTVVHLSSEQLKQDGFVAQSEYLALKILQGNMGKLDMLDEESYDIVYCPVSVSYIPDVNLMFNEVYRVLKKNGIFLFGAKNPFVYLFNSEKRNKGIFEVSNKLPFNTLDERDEHGVKDLLANKEAIEYSHTLEDLIGGQISAGFMISGFYEDIDDDEICKYSPKYFATKAIKL